jgi:hypothetical protein
MATIAVDFDGVIHAYSRGWADGTIYDGPMPGSIKALHQLMARYAVFVHTARTPYPVAQWLEEQGIPTVVETTDTPGHPRTFWDERGHVLVTNRKLPAVAYIDDRGIRFHTWDQALTDLATLT